MNLYAVYGTAFLAMAAIFWAGLAFYDWGERRRLRACELMERRDAHFEATDRQKVRNRSLAIALTLSVGLAWLAPALRDNLSVPLFVTFGLALTISLFHIVAYGIMPILMPQTTAIADIVQMYTGNRGADAERLKEVLVAKLLWNQTFEKADPRAKVLWERAYNAILSNDGSYSARNREIAEIHRCTEAGFPLPPFVEASARREHTRKWDELFSILEAED